MHRAAAARCVALAAAARRQPAAAKGRMAERARLCGAAQRQQQRAGQAGAAVGVRACWPGSVHEQCVRGACRRGSCSWGRGSAGHTPTCVLLLLLLLVAVPAAGTVWAAARSAAAMAPSQSAGTQPPRAQAVPRPQTACTTRKVGVLRQQRCCAAWLLPDHTPGVMQSRHTAPTCAHAALAARQDACGAGSPPRWCVAAAAAAPTETSSASSLRRHHAAAAAATARRRRW
jgi:hypothetical protein